MAYSRLPISKRMFILVVFLLVGTAGSSCALALHAIRETEQARSKESAFSQYGPATPSERELEAMFRTKAGGMDLALANWLIVADIPQFQGMTREAYFKQLDAMTEQVCRDMEAMRPVVKSRGGDPDCPRGRCSLFCGAMIRLHIAYREEFQRENLTIEQNRALYQDADNIFLAGLLRTGRGSCVSMPLLYLVIGRRLGLPVHLVVIGRHSFIRWQEDGLRMNIETTITERVCMTPDDGLYLRTEGKARAEGSEMHNLSEREVVGGLFFAREGHWAAHAPKYENQRRLDIMRAHYLAPEDPAIKAVYEAISAESSLRLFKPVPIGIR